MLKLIKKVYKITAGREKEWVDYCAEVDWTNVKGAGAGAGQHEGDAKADDEPRDYLAASSDEPEESLHLSASSGGPSLTVKKKVKT